LLRAGTVHRCRGGEKRDHDADETFAIHGYAPDPVAPLPFARRRVSAGLFGGLRGMVRQFFGWMPDAALPLRRLPNASTSHFAYWLPMPKNAGTSEATIGTQFMSTALWADCPEQVRNRSRNRERDIKE
jgi:hypothetical protein